MNKFKKLALLFFVAFGGASYLQAADGADGSSDVEVVDVDGDEELGVEAGVGADDVAEARCLIEALELLSTEAESFDSFSAMKQSCLKELSIVFKNSDWRFGTLNMEALRSGMSFSVETDNESACLRSIVMMCSREENFKRILDSCLFLEKPGSPESVSNFITLETFQNVIRVNGIGNLANYEVDFWDEDDGQLKQCTILQYFILKLSDLPAYSFALLSQNALAERMSGIDVINHLANGDRRKVGEALKFVFDMKCAKYLRLRDEKSYGCLKSYFDVNDFKMEDYKISIGDEDASENLLDYAIKIGNKFVVMDIVNSKGFVVQPETMQLVNDLYVSFSILDDVDGCRFDIFQILIKKQIKFVAWQNGWIAWSGRRVKDLFALLGAYGVCRLCWNLFFSSSVADVDAKEVATE